MRHTNINEVLTGLAAEVARLLREFRADHYLEAIRLMYGFDGEAGELTAARRAAARAFGSWPVPSLSEWFIYCAVTGTHPRTGNGVRRHVGLFDAELAAIRLVRRRIHRGAVLYHPMISGFHVDPDGRVLGERPILQDVVTLREPGRDGAVHAVGVTHTNYYRRKGARLLPASFPVLELTLENVRDYLERFFQVSMMEPGKVSTVAAFYGQPQLAATEARVLQARDRNGVAGMVWETGDGSLRCVRHRWSPRVHTWRDLCAAILPGDVMFRGNRRFPYNCYPWLPARWRRPSRRRAG